MKSTKRINSKLTFKENLEYLVKAKCYLKINEIKRIIKENKVSRF